MVTTDRDDEFISEEEMEEKLDQDYETYRDKKRGIF